MMVIDIKLCRFDNVPWGFRLVGGADFEYPLTVVKVHEGSIAEQCGLREGDVIVRINDDATSPLTHEEMDKLIRNCGNTFFLGIYRQPEEGDMHEYDHNLSCAEHVNHEESENFVETFTNGTHQGTERKHKEDAENFVENFTNGTHQATEIHPNDAQYSKDDEEQRTDSVLSENTERKLVEEEIAAVLSGETEVLKEHDVLGILPKAGVCMSSEVLRTLNDYATKTKAEKEQENRKWTTFLQKPNRPIPRSKQQIEAEHRAANAYKVKIVKQSRRSVSPETPVEEEKEEEEEKRKESTSYRPDNEMISEPEREIPTPNDSEVPNLEEEQMDAVEPLEMELIQNSDIEEKADKEKDEFTEMEEQEPTEATKDALPEKTEEELALERQLANVQQQLAALSNLPSTIQVTLDAVTRQLAELVPVFRLQQHTEQLRRQSQQTEPRSISLEKIDEHPTQNEDDDKFTEDNEVVKLKNDCISDNNKIQPKGVMENEAEEEAMDGEQEKLSDNKVTKQIASDTNEAHNTIDKNPINQQEQQQQRGRERDDIMHSARPHLDIGLVEDESKTKKQKRHDVIEELEEHLERKNNPKRSKRAFGPLTPNSDRPLVLPGGRRWYRPKDAYNDEFIAETLTAQAELIAGSALGNYESHPPSYDPRVNFMKYQKPERKIDLNRSEVYKVIHHLDRQPIRGIEVRPSMVAAEADIRKAVHS